MTDAPDIAINVDALEAATEEEMASPLWRISHIYTISSRDASGADSGPIPFNPTPEQREVLEDIFVRGLLFLIIIKSRQLGLSTVVCILILDSILFGSGIQASIVDKTRDDAEKKVDGKVRYAFESLPPHFRRAWRVIKDNNGEFRVRLVGEDKKTESVVYAAISARGGTNHILFISEWGEVQLKDPARSQEILTGALPTAEHPGCLTIVETTWKGGRSGDLWKLVDKGLATAEGLKTPKDPRVKFFGWWTNPNNADDGPPSQISVKTHEYCDEVERLIGRKLTDAQRLWWQKAKDKYGVLMASEHPSTLDECLDSAREDAFFDAEGLAHQHSCAIGSEADLQYGDIHVQEETGYATWERTDPRRALFMINEQPCDGERYVLFGDFCGRRMSPGATGERDTNAIGIMRAGRIDPVSRERTKPKIVATVMPFDRSNTPEAMRRIKALYLLYGCPLTAVEINNKDDIAPRLMAIGVTNQWRQGVVGADNALPGRKKTVEVFGWFTSEGTRKQILDHIQEQTLQQEWDCGFVHVHAQLSKFIYNEDGRAEAAGGDHDDWVMGPAIGLFCLPASSLYVSPAQRIASAMAVAHMHHDPTGI